MLSYLTTWTLDCFTFIAVHTGIKMWASAFWKKGYYKENFRILLSVQGHKLWGWGLDSKVHLLIRTNETFLCFGKWKLSLNPGPDGRDKILQLCWLEVMIMLGNFEVSKVFPIQNEWLDSNNKGSVVRQFHDTWLKTIPTLQNCTIQLEFVNCG